MKAINPYLMFNGNAEEAFEFYQSVFGGKVEKIRYKDMGSEGVTVLSEEEQGWMAHIALPISGPEQILMASDAPKTQAVQIVANANYLVCLYTDNTEETEKVYKSLSEGGQILMPLEKTEFADLFAMLTDKFGIQWMISYDET